MAFEGRPDRHHWGGFHASEENLRVILFMLLAMGGFAIEDGMIKKLTDNFPVSEILIMTGALGALSFAILAKIGKAAL